MESLKAITEKIRANTPLVHNITNYVVMNTTANALLAIGASPVMAHANQEIEDIVSIASSLVINMGTLSEKWIEAMQSAVKKAHTTNTPYVFDPVGVGASSYRTEMAQALVDCARPNVIRGNASEIMALAHSATTTRGVDSTIDSQDALSAAESLSNMLGNTIVISGETDYVVTQERVDKITGGSPLMAKVTGMGCTATSIVGACIGIEADYHLAACTAMQIMSEAGAKAESLSNGPGSFQMHFLDSLHNL